MGIITAIVFCFAIVYYLVHYTIRFIRFLKKIAGNKKVNGPDKVMRPDVSDRMKEIVFPGGDDEIEEEVEKLYLLLQEAHPEELLKIVFVGGSVYFAQSEDKSEGKTIAYIQGLSQSSLTAKEGKLIHDFIYSRALRVQFFTDEEESHFDNFINDVNELTGCDEDEIPGGTGAFGLTLSNPVPLKGIVSNEYYLNRIRTWDGERITWQRTGSTIPLHSSQPVDVYQIFDVEGKEIARFYLSPYHKRVSNKAPDGFKLLTKTDLTTAGTRQPETHFSEPTVTYPEENDRKPASVIIRTTGPEGNEEIEVHDLRLLSASTALLATSAALLIPDLDGAAEHLKEAVTRLDDFPGPDDARTIHLLKSASRLSEQLNEADTAERLLERALKAQITSIKNDPELLSDTQFDLGILHMTKRNLERAETLFRESLLIRQKLFGLEHEKTAQVILAFGMVLEQGPSTEEAENLFRQALTLFRKIYGEEHLKTALVLDNLAGTLLKQNKTEEALPLAEKAYAVFTREEGTKKPNTVRSMSTIAIIYKRHGRLAEAEHLQRQLLTVLEKVYGPDHQSCGVELGNLAGILMEKGEEKEAMAFFYRALYVKEEGMNPDHPGIAHTLVNLAGFHAKMGEFAKAEPLAKRAYQIRAKALGDFHPETQESFSLLEIISRSILHF